MVDHVLSQPLCFPPSVPAAVTLVAVYTAVSGLYVCWAGQVVLALVARFDGT